MISKRIFIERRPGFDIESKNLKNQIKLLFNLDLTNFRYLVIYDIFDIDEETLNLSIKDVFSEPNRDFVYEDVSLPMTYIAIEYLPGQFDQRADSAKQCVKLLNPASNLEITSGYMMMFDDLLTNDELTTLKNFYINKVESREKDLTIFIKPTTKETKEVSILSGFINLNDKELLNFYKANQYAMSFEDLKFIQNYFKNDEQRDPYITEVKVLDTYWSDHCRHTTFETELKDIVFEPGNISKIIESTFNEYLETRKRLGIKKPITLMDLATINSKLERSDGNLDNLEISDEINACSIYIDVLVEDKIEEWLLMFKNETHNHPTEIEPFGGASTCIGGAIRDPLSGRSYVYGAMRITGAGDITKPIEETLEGKLPQRVISKTAALGYSSYGNQIGIPTTYVNEIFHEGYVAKRMEVGAVIGAVKASDIIRKKPTKGDLVVVLGGRTGRDGIGGATGSSKTHNEASINEASSEVQKGNAPEERKILRLFRNKEVTRLIKKSNDFGAGGVSVAIGELADGVEIDLDKLPTKYFGINGTELAISESQERMAVVIDPKDVDKFINFCYQENIEANIVAKVTDKKRLTMSWNNKKICDLSRNFIDTSGIRQNVNVTYIEPKKINPFSRDYEGNNLMEKVFSMLCDANIASQEGLVEMFDSSIGRTTVLSPYGGLYKKTKTFSSVQKIPVLNKKTKTASIMTYGYDPYLSSWSQYHGSTYAIIDSIAKVIASGGDYKNIRFSFQEYFEKLEKDPYKWQLPFSSLLGAYKTLKEFKLAAIGGKDSMSGTFNDLSVPPTLISFAVTTESVDNIISPEFKEPENFLYLLPIEYDGFFLPNINKLKSNYDFIKTNINFKTIISAYPLGYGGLAEAIVKSTFGNKIGVVIDTSYPLFKVSYGSILFESKKLLENEDLIYLGKTTDNQEIIINANKFTISECIEKNEVRYKNIYPILSKKGKEFKSFKSPQIKNNFKTENIKSVTVLSPVFPGTNCEYDTQQAFVEEGAVVETFIFNNQDEKSIKNSITEFSKKLSDVDILVLNGGFSSGDEPDGSGKFIASILKNKEVASAINEFLKAKKLILGICNGFQALIKSGLLPYGKVVQIDEASPTLFKNDINRHISKFADTKVSSTNSPWLANFLIDETHTVAMSHGEGKFVINEEEYKKLVNKNQIAFQYVDDLNQPTSNPLYNINGSDYAIEGIISEDGLILGKMGHSERYEPDLFKNIIGNKDQNIFRNAIMYFKNGGIK